MGKFSKFAGSMGGGLLLGAGAQVLGSLIGGGARRRAERAARDRVDMLQNKLNNLENSRQDIVNPYANVTNLSELATDLSANLTNPYANLGVATQAAEIQIEQADISLANTLDTLRSTGSGAGGATALAQAALQSKKGVSASIEQQEANNEKLRAQGEQQMEQLKMQEGARIQSIQISEGGRTQGLQAAGQQFMFNAREGREMQQLDRASAQLAGAQGQAMQASNARQASTAGLMSGLAGLGGSYLTGLAGANSNRYNANPDTPSDRRLKKNIKLIGFSPKNLKIYAFEYIDNKFGKGVFQGVMSDEIPNEAVVKNSDGFDRVDYSKLDVEFKLIK
jgi:hypothetical protein